MLQSKYTVRIVHITWNISPLTTARMIYGICSTQVLKINRLRLSQNSDKELILSADLECSHQSPYIHQFSHPVEQTPALTSIETISVQPDIQNQKGTN